MRGKDGSHPSGCPGSIRNIVNQKSHRFFLFPTGLSYHRESNCQAGFLKKSPEEEIVLREMRVQFPNDISRFHAPGFPAP